MLKLDEYKLRPLVKSDLETVLTWRNSDRIRACMYSDHIISLSEHHAWFSQIQQSEFPTFLIFEGSDRRLGVTSFSNFDQNRNRCTWGFYLGEIDVPKGTGSIMGFMALKYIFEQHDFHKVCAEAFACNDASIRYHQRLGFVQEGLLRKHVLKNEEFQDIMIFGYLRDEWMEKKKKLEDSLFGEV